MVDMVLLLHGNAQPLSRIQPQLTDFFNEHYLQGREPSDANIEVRTVHSLTLLSYSNLKLMYCISISSCDTCLLTVHTRAGSQV